MNASCLRINSIMIQTIFCCTGGCEVKHATSRSRRFPTIFNLYELAGKKQFVSLKLECQSGFRTRDLRLSKQAALTTVCDQLQAIKIIQRFCIIMLHLHIASKKCCLLFWKSSLIFQSNLPMFSYFTCS